MVRHLPLLALVACVAAPPNAPDAPGPDTDAIATDTEPDTDPVAETEGVDTDTGTVPIDLELVEADDVVAEGEAYELSVRVRRATDPSRLVLTLASDADGPLPPPTLDGDVFRWSLSGMSAGEHVLTITADAPDGGHDELTVDMGVCRWPELEDFNAPTLSADWRTFGDAYLDPGGWLEITGNVQTRKGAIFKVANKVNPGDVRIEFDIATGGGINSGADGYAVTIIDVADETELAAYVAAAADGGCLAYGSAPPCASLPVNAFHIEFDTWHNQANPVNDPTPNNHIAITLDGNPSDHLLWQSVPSLEDLTWRRVVVQILGTRIRVRLDGQLIIDDVIPNFTFDGGYIGVSGSTGWATNWHRFDNLQVFDRCTVPDRAAP